MKFRLEEIEVPEDAPFKNDALKRSIGSGRMGRINLAGVAAKVDMAAMIGEGM